MRQLHTLASHLAHPNTRFSSFVSATIAAVPHGHVTTPGVAGMEGGGGGDGLTVAVRVPSLTTAAAVGVRDPV